MSWLNWRIRKPFSYFREVRNFFFWLASIVAYVYWLSRKHSFWELRRQLSIVIPPRYISACDVTRCSRNASTPKIRRLMRHRWRKCSMGSGSSLQDRHRSPCRYPILNICPTSENRHNSSSSPPAFRQNKLCKMVVWFWKEKFVMSRGI